MYELLAGFNALGVNLTKLESHPVVGRDFEFRFFFDLEASAFRPQVLGMLEELEKSCEMFAFMGNYCEL